MSSFISKPTKYELIRSLQKMNIHQIQVFEPYVQTDIKHLNKVWNQINQKPGEVTLIMVRSR